MLESERGHLGLQVPRQQFPGPPDKSLTAPYKGPSSSSTQGEGFQKQEVLELAVLRALYIISLDLHTLRK